MLCKYVHYNKPWGQVSPSLPKSQGQNSGVLWTFWKPSFVLFINFKMKFNISSFSLFYYYFYFWDRISCILGWRQTHYVAKGELEVNNYFIIFILCICLWSWVYVWAPQACRYLQRPEEDVGSPGTGVNRQLEATQSSVQRGSRNPKSFLCVRQALCQLSYILSPKWEYFRCCCLIFLLCLISLSPVLWWFEWDWPP